MTRRDLLWWTGAVPCCAHGQRVASTSEMRRYLDPATENEVLRLTDPAHSSLLPPSFARPASSRSNSLLFVSDRSGAPQAYRIDLRSGQVRPLTEAAALQPESVAQSADERVVAFVDGALVQAVSGALGRPRDLHSIPQGATLSLRPRFSDRGTLLAWGETAGARQAVRAYSFASRSVRTMLDVDAQLREFALQPRSGAMAAVAGERIVWVGAGGGRPAPLTTPEGQPSGLVWSADGQSLFYLLRPLTSRVLPSIREVRWESKEERLIAFTSQFVQFDRNGDASVFVGASSSKASPLVFLLSRIGRRELALCEHRTGEPQSIRPQFSPNSQRIFFQSDRHGKPAIYSMRVERLVELTESDEEK